MGYLIVNDSTGKCLLNVFLKQPEELGLKSSDCRSQCNDNGADIKGNEAGLQARFLQINSKAFYIPCTNPLLNLLWYIARNLPLKHCYFLVC